MCTHVLMTPCAGRTSRTSLLVFYHCDNDKSTKATFLQRQPFYKGNTLQIYFGYAARVLAPPTSVQSSDTLQLHVHNFKLLHLCYWEQSRIWTMDCWFIVLNRNRDIFKIIHMQHAKRLLLALLRFEHSRIFCIWNYSLNKFFNFEDSKFLHLWRCCFWT